MSWQSIPEFFPLSGSFSAFLYDLCCLNDKFMNVRVPTHLWCLTSVSVSVGKVLFACVRTVVEPVCLRAFKLVWQLGGLVIVINRCKFRRKTEIRLTAQVPLACWFRVAPRIMPWQKDGGINFQNTKPMAILSGLSSQIVCGPGVFFPPFRATFWCLFWVWGPSGTPWFSALNLTGIYTSILIYFWV